MKYWVFVVSITLSFAIAIPSQGTTPPTPGPQGQGYCTELPIPPTGPMPDYYKDLLAGCKYGLNSCCGTSVSSMFYLGGCKLAPNQDANSAGCPSDMRAQRILCEVNPDIPEDDKSYVWCEKVRK